MGTIRPARRGRPYIGQPLAPPPAPSVRPLQAMVVRSDARRAGRVVFARPPVGASGTLARPPQSVVSRPPNRRHAGLVVQARPPAPAPAVAGARLSLTQRRTPHRGLVVQTRVPGPAPIAPAAPAPHAPVVARLPAAPRRPGLVVFARPPLAPATPTRLPRAVVLRRELPVAYRRGLVVMGRALVTPPPPPAAITGAARLWSETHRPATFTEAPRPLIWDDSPGKTTWDT